MCIPLIPARPTDVVIYIHWCVWSDLGGKSGLFYSVDNSFTRLAGEFFFFSCGYVSIGPEVDYEGQASNAFLRPEIYLIISEIM